MNSVTLDNISVGVVAQILPILSIFGQDLTNTFLRESLSWSDYIIFAVGPLGIIWVLTAILKTIGPEKLKKYIQNSYDEPLIEQALMSSTSSEVCELWNGREVVRLIRKAPRIREFFVINGELYDSKKIKDKYQDVDGYFKPRDPRRLRSKILFNGKRDKPPNLLLNLGPVKRKKKARRICMLAILFQAGLIVLFATMKYSSRLSQFRIFTYSFCCSTAGTMILFFGLITAAHQIGHTCEQIIWERTHNPSIPEPLAIWLQRGLEDDDHDKFTSRIVIKKIRDEFLESHRKEENQKEDKDEDIITSDGNKLVSVLAFVSVAGGYASQVIGVAGMHYPTQFALFGITLTMTMARMFLRPIPRPTNDVQTYPNHEMNWLALVLALANPGALVKTNKAPRWTPDTPRKWLRRMNEDSPNTKKLSHIWNEIHNVCEWTCPATEHAESIARSLERVANSWDIDECDILEWEIPISCYNATRESLKLSMRKSAGRWKVDEQETRSIQFALSLWLFYDSETKTASRSDWTVLFLGSEKIRGTLENFWPRLTRIYFERLRYLTKPDGDRDVGENQDNCQIDRHLLVGFQDKFTLDSPDARNHTREVSFQVARHWEFQGTNFLCGYIPAILMRSDSSSLFARHIFSSFMWKYATKMRRELIIDLTIQHDWYTQERTFLMEVARNVVETGLGDEHIVLLMILAPLIHRKMSLI